MSTRNDVIIIGAGHNGLVTAFYLARGGLKPLVVERRPVVGGAAITDEFTPGFKCSTLAHWAGPFAPEVAREMQLQRCGLEIIRPDPAVFAPQPDGSALRLYRDGAQSAQEIARFSRSDAERFPEFERVLARIAGVVRQLMFKTPPSLDQPTARDFWNLLEATQSFRGLGKKNMRRLLRWAPMPVADLVAEWFESELLRATIAARGIFGSFLGPRSGGSTAGLLLRAASDPHAAGAPDFPRGGMGALAHALAVAAIEAGAEIRTGAEVAEITVRDGSVTGVVLAGGEAVAGQTVVSNADPRRTFLRLIDPAHLDPSFVVKMQNYRCQGTMAKVNLALAGMPSFTALEGRGDSARAALAGRIHIGPELDYLERAFDAAKYGEFSAHPVLDVAIPSIADPSLAPPGHHVMSIAAQFAPFKLRHGDWRGQREALGNVVTQTLADYAPKLPSLILDRQVITPQDLEDTYALSGGHIFHGELALDQLFTMRPLLGWARYRTPIKGLYLCGSGTHPGSGLTGASGRNAAREILRDWKKSRRVQLKLN